MKQRPVEQQELYIDLLRRVGALSRLFSDSSTPYMYYRAMENIFSMAFDATNQSRSDISYDASCAVDGVGIYGIGLKTFLHNNGRTIQKVAEFNKDRELYANLSTRDIVFSIAEKRNKRIEFASNLVGASVSHYHLLTRRSGELQIHEMMMDTIDMSHIRVGVPKRNVIPFTDGKKLYQINLSKSTLYMQFDLTGPDTLQYEFDVPILDDPYSFLREMALFEDKYELNPENLSKLRNDSHVIDEIILPLYTMKHGMRMVEERSGLNMWNAGGRDRNPDEVYIRVPKWIHEVKPDFFADYYNPVIGENKTDTFIANLPNGTQLPLRVTQQNGKAIQSNPNKLLGKWLLRDVLDIPYDHSDPITIRDLDDRGIDSVRLSKTVEGDFYLDFVAIGSFDSFESEMKP